MAQMTDFKYEGTQNTIHRQILERGWFEDTCYLKKRQTTLKVPKACTEIIGLIPVGWSRARNSKKLLLHKGNKPACWQEAKLISMFHSNLEQAECCIFLSIPVKHWILANGSSAVVFIIVLTLPPFPKLTEAQETDSFVTRKNVSACSLATSIGQSRIRAF